MTCPLLEFRTEEDGRTFTEPRPFCTAVDRFVQPMRADICNDRYDLHHADHCEVFREHADGVAEPVNGVTSSSDRDLDP